MTENSWFKKTYYFIFSKTNIIWHQLWRYIIVGGIAAVVDIGSFSIFNLVWHWHYAIATTLSFTLGVITNYLLSRIWVFNTQAKINLKEFISFLIIGIIGWGLNVLTLYILIDLLGTHSFIAKLIATAITFLWNFLARKYITFRKDE